MPVPTAGTLAYELYTGPLEPYTAEDAENDFALGTFLTAMLAGAQEIADLVRDDPVTGAVGWSALVNADRAPEWALPWLASLVGVTDAPWLADPERRLRIKATAGQHRGTVAAMQGAARQYLVGPDGTGESATVYFSERHGSAYRLSVATLAAETPDADMVEAALLEQKPAGIVLTYTVLGAGDYNELAATHATYTEVDTDFTDYFDVLSDPSQT